MLFVSISLFSICSMHEMHASGQLPELKRAPLLLPHSQFFPRRAAMGSDAP